MFTVKQNTPALWDEIDALDWASVPVQQVTEEKGHGRRERRTIQVMNAPEHVTRRFPHARQVALIERYVTRTVRVNRYGIRFPSHTAVAAIPSARVSTPTSARMAHSSP